MSPVILREPIEHGAFLSVMGPSGTQGGRIVRIPLSADTGTIWRFPSRSFIGTCPLSFSENSRCDIEDSTAFQAEQCSLNH